MTSALLIVDIQRDYFPGGAVALVGIDGAAARAARALDAFRHSGDPVFFVQHLSNREGATFFVPGTDGAEIHESVAPARGEPVIQKHFPNSFRETSLHAQASAAGIDHLVVCGAMSHMCIDATTRAGFDLGYRCTVLEDACATRDLEFHGRTLPASEVHGAFMAALSSPYATVTATEEFLANP